MTEQKKVTHADTETAPITSQLLAKQEKYTINTYLRPPIVLSHGKGCRVYDLANREYLDFSAGIAVNALGHSDPELARVIHEQALKLVHLSNLYHNEYAGELAELLVESTRSGGGFEASKVFFTNSGTYNDISKINEYVTDKTCAVIIEPIQGEGGAWEATVPFIEALRKRCDEVEALLIFDEIQCGLGRTGKLWAHQNYPKSCHPDILTLAKPLANGFPIGAILTTQPVADIIKIGDHGTTFGGSPLACRAALSVVSRINTPELLTNVNNVGSYLKSSFERFATKYPSLITTVRGRGLILGIQFTKNPSEMVKLARERGLLIITAGNDTVRIVPPLILTKGEAEKGVAILEECLEIFEKEHN